MKAKKKVSKIIKTAKKKTVKKAVKKQTGTSDKKRDGELSAKLPGLRISLDGKKYYEYRANRSDINPRAKKGKKL